jgi:pimeloyl-ACP methyl ester carboxylesterase
MNTFAAAAVLSLAECALFATRCLAQDAQKVVVTDPVYTKAQRLVDVDHGRRMNIYCRGTGSPTVVFDAGLGDSSSSWGLVQPNIATRTRACSYDRAGLGFSDPAGRASTAKHIAEDLHSLLAAADVKPPYLLVGHSSSGMSIRVYVDRYFDEVVGMVLVDPSHEDQWVRSWAIGAPGQKEQMDASLAEQAQCVDAAKKGFAKDTPIYQQCLDYVDPHVSQAINEAQRPIWATPGWQAAFLSERESTPYASAEQTRATRKHFGDMPIFVLTHAPHTKAQNETQEQADQRTLLWEDLHSQVAAMSTRGVNVIVPNSGHYIQFDRPQIVIDAVNGAIAISRDRMNK